MALFNNACQDLHYAFYYNGHFLFAYRYFEVAEMFGREDKSLAKHEKNRGITAKISYVCVAIISMNFLLNFGNYGIYRRVTGEYNHTLDKWTYTYLPGMFLLMYCILLLVALVWICRSLKNDPEVMGNERWMAIHSILLILTLVAYIWVNLLFLDDSGYTSYKIY
jgi:hypothetical protein